MTEPILETEASGWDKLWPPEAKQKPVLGRYFPTVVAIVFGVALSLALFFTLREAERSRLQTEFNRRAGTRAAILRTGIDGYLDALTSAALYLSSGEQIERAEFRSLRENAYAWHRGIQALGWVPRVRAADRPKFEEQARAEGCRDFVITERDEQGAVTKASPRDEYFPNFYVEPLAGNEAVLGFDAFSDAIRREAMERAVESGLPAVTSPTHLLQAPDKPDGILIFVPVYGARHATSVTAAERRQSLKGFVTLTFCISDLVRTAFINVPSSGLDTYVYDLSVAPPGGLLCAMQDSGKLPLAESQSPDLRWSAKIEFGGRPWQLVFRPSKDFLANLETWHAWLVLGSGLLLTLLLGGYLRTVAGRTANIEFLVAKRTLELLDVNDNLRSEIQERQRAEAELAAANQKLQKLAREDVLTGLLNRRTIFEVANSEWSLWRRYRREFSLLIIDVDNFKGINDHYGHPAGDQALRLLAAQLKQSVRQTDTLGRFGGEEFMVILPVSTLAGAVAVGQKIVENIRQLKFQFDSHDIKITVSVGVATTDPADNTLDDVLHRADAALYIAKGEGKDRVVAKQHPTDNGVLAQPTA